MRKSKTLARIRAGETVRICGLGHFIPSYVCHAAHFGYDCIWLDMEHRLIDEREAQMLLALSHQYDIDIMLRAPTLEKTRLYRYLEDGAQGLMIPHVSTVEKAKDLVDSTKFPPIGDRGLDGAGLDSNFYLDGGAGYTDAANNETFLVVQIETPEAVENVEEIAATPGLDGMFVGPGDLGLRLGLSGGEMTLESAIERVAAAAKANGVAWGCPVGNQQLLQKRVSQGGQLIANAGEFMAIMDTLKNGIQEFE